MRASRSSLSRTSRKGLVVIASAPGSHADASVLVADPEPVAMDRAKGFKLTDEETAYLAQAIQDFISSEINYILITRKL